MPPKASSAKPKRTSTKKPRASASPPKSAPRAESKPATVDGVVLLSGGNPQIAKGEGDAPVQAYIRAMPEWKRAVGARLDALIVRTVPHVKKAVKWNSPFYGVEGQGYFLAFHVFARYVKVTFLRGTSLEPLPPIESKDPHTRYLHVFEDGELDERQFVDWVAQAAAIPGWQP